MKDNNDEKIMKDAIAAMQDSEVTEKDILARSILNKMSKDADVERKVNLAISGANIREILAKRLEREKLIKQRDREVRSIVEEKIPH